MQPDQLILSPADSEAVRQLARRAGKTEAELLHDVIAGLMEEAKLERWQAALTRIEGLWADHPDVPDVRALRAGWNARTERLDAADHD